MRAAQAAAQQAARQAAQPDPFARALGEDYRNAWPGATEAGPSPVASALARARQGRISPLPDDPVTRFSMAIRQVRAWRGAIWAAMGGISGRKARRRHLGACSWDIGLHAAVCGQVLRAGALRRFQPPCGFARRAQFQAPKRLPQPVQPGFAPGWCMGRNRCRKCRILFTAQVGDAAASACNRLAPGHHLSGQRPAASSGAGSARCPPRPPTPRHGAGSLRQHAAPHMPACAGIKKDSKL